MTAQTTRAILLAMATVTTRTGFRASKSTMRGSTLSGFDLARRTTDVAPMTRSLRKYLSPILDAAKPLLAAARVLKRRQPQPSRELTAGSELARIGDGCGQRRRAHGADARDRRQTAGDIIGTLQGNQSAIDLLQLSMRAERLL